MSFMRQIDMAYFSRSEKRTERPLKGVASYYDIQLHGRLYKHAAWLYETVYDFDAQLLQIEELMAFDQQKIMSHELSTFVFEFDR